MNPPATEAEIYSVSRLNREARLLLESGLQGCWVCGEISNLARPASGHLYFSLKDGQAQVQCAMFRSAQRGLRFRPADGLQVVVQGTVSIYEARGNYQIIIERMEESGEGLLRRRLEELRQKLQQEGLFAAEHKQPLPQYPVRIGVITSPSGAALRDILQVLQRRFPLAAVIVYPTRVQGTGSAEEIAAAIATAAARAECDVLVIGRGGGSLEDLWSFNEEVVVRAIHRCTLPTVSAVGHEIDTTLADLAADQRAPTPSAAAELVVPETQTLRQLLAESQIRIGKSLQRQLQTLRHQCGQLDGRLQRAHPGSVLQQRQQRVDELLRRLQQQMLRLLASTRQSCLHSQRRLQQSNMLPRIRTARATLESQQGRLARAMQLQLERRRLQLGAVAASLQAVSPLATLERGYAIARTSDGTVLRDAGQVQSGSRIDIRLARGHLQAEVTRSDEN